MTNPAPSHFSPDIDKLGQWDEKDAAPFAAREVVAAYNGLRVFESDYDKAQGQLRTIASAWLLSGIGALGLITNAELGKTASLDKVVASDMRQIVLLVLGLGLTSIWRLDQKVYQHLLHCVFALGYEIELNFRCVPPVRMQLYHFNRDIT